MLRETINLSRNCCKKNAGKYLELNAYHKRGKANACLTDSIALSTTNCILLKRLVFLSAVLINKTLNIIVIVWIIKCINHFLSVRINLFLSYAICYTQIRY